MIQALDITLSVINFVMIVYVLQRRQIWKVVRNMYPPHYELLVRMVGTLMACAYISKALKYTAPSIADFIITANIAIIIALLISAYDTFKLRHTDNV
jgi:hypothetical protein